MSENSATAFFDTWQTYRKVVAANYMYHVEIKADIERLLRARYAGRRVSFLDLGCGDAATIAPVLEHMAPERYRACCRKSEIPALPRGVDAPRYSRGA
jgi:hypothetical protein